MCVRACVCEREGECVCLRVFVFVSEYVCMRVCVHKCV